MHMPTNNRIAYTLLFVSIFINLIHIPLPFVDMVSILSYFYSIDVGFAGVRPYLERASIMFVGINAFCLASVLTEIFSVFSSRLRKVKNDSKHGRNKLNRISIVLTLFIAGFLGYYQSTSLISLEYGQLLLIDNILFLQIFCVTTGIASAYLSIWISSQITCLGVVNGVSALVIIQGGFQFFFELSAWVRDPVHEYNPTVRNTLLIMIAIIFIFTFFMLLPKRHYRINQHKNLSLSFMVSGVFPVNVVTGSLTLAPLTLFSVFQYNLMYRYLYLGLLVFLFLVLNLICARAFYNSERIANSLKVDRITKSNIKAFVNTSMLVNAVYGGIVVFTDYYIMNSNYHAGSQILYVSIFSAFVLDLGTTVNVLKNKGDFVTIEIYQEIYIVDSVSSILNDANIPHYFLGRNHRTMLHFFAPYVQTSLWVEKKHVEEAKRVLSECDIFRKGIH